MACRPQLSAGRAETKAHHRVDQPPDRARLTVRSFLRDRVRLEVRIQPAGAGPAADDGMQPPRLVEEADAVSQLAPQALKEGFRTRTAGPDPRRAQLQVIPRQDLSSDDASDGRQGPLEQLKPVADQRGSSPVVRRRGWP
jgi:hypothetical protein